MSISEPSRTSPSDPVLILMDFLYYMYHNWILVLELDIWRWDELNVEVQCQSMSSNQNSRNL